MMIWSSKTARTLLLSFRYSMVTIDSIHMIYSEVVVVWNFILDTMLIQKKNIY